VKPILQWSLKQKGWRALLAIMALLTMLWLLVVAVFASEFYFSANGMGWKISWADAALNEFRDWYPWVWLSPAVVFLAVRFRFQSGGVWWRTFAVHVVACAFFSTLYVLLLDGLNPFSAPGGASVQGIGGMGGVGGSGGEGDEEGGASVDNGHGVDSHLESDLRHGDVGIASPLDPKEDIRFFTIPHRWQRFVFLGSMKAQLTVPVYCCIVFVCWIVIHLREASKLETLLVQSNLQALKMQLQPHFLFNTLNAISSLIHEDPKMADDMIGSLSQFLRATLESSSANEIPLSEELKFVDCYLEIQETRFGDRLKIQREIDGAVLDASVPALILQPLVENAVRYGIEPLEAGGTVTLKAWRSGDILRLQVSDTGPGFDQVSQSNSGSGIGLSNTRARLRTLYGDKHRFQLTNAVPRGACVSIEIPFQLIAVDSSTES